MHSGFGSPLSIHFLPEDLQKASLQGKPSFPQHLAPGEQDVATCASALRVVLGAVLPAGTLPLCCCMALG